MALSGSHYTNVGSHWRLQQEWSATQDHAANQSTITVRLYWMGLDSYSAVSSSASKSVAQYIQDGWSPTASTTAGLSAGQKKLIHTYSKTVTHNSDGKFTMNIDGWFDAEVTLSGTYYGRINLSTAYFPLDDIPRASNLTSTANYTAGGDLTLSVQRFSSTFHHWAWFYVKNTAGTWINVDSKKFDASGVWQPTYAGGDSNVFTELAQRSSAEFRILLQTWSDGTYSSLIGDKYYYGTVTAPAATSVDGVFDSDRYIDETFPVSLNRANIDFVHTIKLTVGSFVKTQTGVGTAHTWDWTTTEENTLYGLLSTVEAKAGTLEITTFYNSIQVRTPVTVNITLRVRNANPSFADSQIDYSDTNTAISTITGNNKWIVQNKSNLKATINSAATAQKGASITKYIATVNGESQTILPPFTYPITIDFATINATTDKTLEITAYDSRNFTAKASKVVEVAAWSPPVINSTAERTNGFLNETTLTLGGTISPVSVGTTPVNKNSLVAAEVKYRYRQIGAAWSAYTVFTGQTLTMPNYSALSTLINGSTGLANTSAWEVEVLVTDKFGSNTRLLSVGTGTPIMHIDDVKNAVGIGKFPSFDNGLDVAGDLYVDGIRQNQGNTLPSGDGTLAYWHSVKPGIYMASPDNVTGQPTSYGLVHVIKQGTSEFSVMWYAQANGSIYRKSGNGNTITGWIELAFVTTLFPKIDGAFGNIFKSSDEWLRINDGTDKHINGVYFNTSVVRTDGELQVGSAGADFKANSTNTYVNGSAIVESGSNANGNWVKFYDGLMICWWYAETTSFAMNNAYVGLYQGSWRWTYPIAFVGVSPSVTAGKTMWGTSASWSTVASQTNTYADLRGMDVASRGTGTTVYMCMTAIGRWK